MRGQPLTLPTRRMGGVRDGGVRDGGVRDGGVRDGGCIK
jgi:hypothetical protein